MLGNNADFSNHCHIIGITRPARHNMHVEMLSDASASSRTEIQTYIKSLRIQCLLQDMFTACRQLKKFGTIRWPLLYG